MKAESNIKPTEKHQLSVFDKKIIITFFENIVVETVDGVEKYCYDTFEVVVPNTADGMDNIENGLEKLLEEAKRNEASSQVPAEPTLAEMVIQNRADLDYLLMFAE